MKKKALDLSFLDNIKPVGGGIVGTYYGNFNPQEIQAIKDKIGLRSHDTGIKITRNNLYGVNENIALYFIMPYIEANTNIKTPKPQMPLTLKTLSENVVFTQHIKGVHLRTLIPDYSAFLGAEAFTAKAIKQKLQKIGIIWTDAHAGNYLVNPQTARQKADVLKNLPQPDEAYDFSDDITIVDVGYFKCRNNTPPAKKLTILKQKLNSLPNQTPYGIIQDIVFEIDSMIYK